MIQLISKQINQPQISRVNQNNSTPRLNNLKPMNKDVFKPSFQGGKQAFPLKAIEETGLQYLKKLTDEMPVLDKSKIIGDYCNEARSKIPYFSNVPKSSKKGRSFINKHIDKAKIKLSRDKDDMSEFMGDFSHEAFDSFPSVQRLRIMRAAKQEPSVAKQHEIADVSVKAAIDNVNETSARYQYLLDNKFFREKTTRGAKKVFGKIMETFEGKAKAKGITLNVEGKDVLKKYSLSTYSDRKNDSILSNLIANAIKYSPENSTIDMKFFVNDTDNFLHFSIKDHGIGIPTEDQAGIFNRKRASNTGEIPGTGYGLFRASNYVKAATKSEIKVTSPLYPDEAENKGTMFECALISNTKKSIFEKLKNIIINALGI